MAVSSLIIDLAPDGVGEAARTALAADPRVTLGPRAGNRQALVVDCPTAEGDIAFYEHLQRQAGVRLVTLVAAYLDDEAPATGAAYL
jgi:hypothetical protein